MESRSQRYNCGKRYLRKPEPWEYRMPLWMFLGVYAVIGWMCYKIATLVFS